jgi:hypothetical protein
MNARSAFANEPEFRQRLPTREASWLAALDDFRNYLITAA